MSESLSSSKEFACGDVTRRRAGIAAIACLVGVLVSLGLFLNLEELWDHIMSQEGIMFAVTTPLFGGLLAVAPVCVVVGFLLTVWFSVESVYQPRSRVSPLLDRLIVAMGLLTWFGPTLAMAGAAVVALFTGKVHFVRPPRDYFLTTDPVAYWQGVGFWLITAAILGFFAWKYWRNKFLKASE